jgi:hypothetical protein
LEIASLRAVSRPPTAKIVKTVSKQQKNAFSIGFLGTRAPFS